MAGLANPIAVNARGRLATVSEARHIRALIESVLFTSPGERVNRPDFGSGIRQLVFAPTTSAIAAAVQANVQASLQMWLGDVLLIESVDTRSEESTLHIRVIYRRLDSGDRNAETFTMPTESPT